MGNVDLTALRKHTVLCKVYASAHGMSRVDRVAAARAEESGVLGHGAKVVVATNPQLATLHADIVAAQQEARMVLRRLSLPYLDEDGWRVLPVSNLGKFVAGYAKAKQKFDVVRNSYISANSPVMVTQGNFDDGPETPPEGEEGARARAVADAYSLDWRVHDYPAATFAGLAEKAATGLKERHEKELARVVAGIRSKAIQRLAEPVEHMAKRLATHTEALAGGNKASLRSSMLDNIIEAAHVVRSFNVYNDITLAALADGAEALAQLDIVTLRSDANAARGAAEAARAFAVKANNICNDPLLTLAG